MVAKNALSESHNAGLMSLSPEFTKLPRFKALFVAKNKTELCLYVEGQHRPVELNVALNTVALKMGRGGGWSWQKVCRASESLAVLYIQDQLCTLPKHLLLSQTT